MLFFDNAAADGWVLWAGSAVLFLYAPAAAAESALGSCADPRITLEGELDARWVGSLNHLCAELTHMQNVDPSARLRLVAAGADVIVEAVLGDGRSALRRVQAPDDLVLTVEALTLLPPAEATAQGSAAPSAEPAEKQPEPAAADKAIPAKQRGTVGVELGAEVIGRVERSPSYLSTGIGAYAGIRLGASLLAVSMRWDVIEVLTSTAPPAFEMDNVGVGFTFLRRLALADALALDLGGQVMVLGQTQRGEVNAMPDTDTEADVRLGAMSRAVFGEGEWRFTVGLGADFSPARLRHTERVFPRFPTLPLWGVGLSIGTLWGDA